MPEAVIVDAIRTPIGRAFKGSLATLRPDETLTYAIDQVLERNPGVDPGTVEEVIAGCAQPQGLQANNVARIAVLLSDKLGPQTAGSTINRYCSAGLDAIRTAANNIRVGQGDTYIAAGVEFVSRYNEAQEAARPEDRHGSLQGKEPGQPDAFIAMGMTAENVAERYGVSREQQDEYAQRSQERAVAAQQAGFFDREIVPVRVNGTVVSVDDGPRASSTLEKLGTLEPAFKPGGSVTAGNSCPLNDGAAASIVMSADKAKELGLRPRARIITAATQGNEPEYMGVAPIGAIKKALERAGMSIDDVDVYELNEAFAAQVIPIAEAVGFDYDKLNPHGGAIALGHPFGMTGVRMMATLLNDLETLDGAIGLETMCVAQGQGEAMIIERLS
jgi:acetyl-CoA C-acetyltransferase